MLYCFLSSFLFFIKRHPVRGLKPNTAVPKYYGQFSFIKRHPVRGLKQFDFNVVWLVTVPFIKRHPVRGLKPSGRA